LEENAWEKMNEQVEEIGKNVSKGLWG